MSLSSLILTPNGYCEVTQILEKDSVCVVYNFEVENTHTYLIGEEGLTVHNDCVWFSKLNLPDDQLTKLKRLLESNPNFLARMKTVFGENTDAVNSFLKFVNENPTLVSKFEDGTLSFRAWEGLRRANSDFIKTGKLNAAAIENMSTVVTKLGFTDVNDIKLLYQGLNPKADGLEVLSKLAKKTSAGNDLGLNKLISDLKHTVQNKKDGANFVLKTIKSKGDAFISKIKKLEAYETDEIAGTRFYDILIKDGDDFIYIECKHWLNWHGSTFTGQFFKDLQNMSEIGSHKWIFAKLTNISDQASLKNYVMNTLGTLDGSGNWVAKANVFDGVDLAKMKTLLNKPLLTNETKGQAILDWLNTNFDSIFEVL